MDTLRLFLATVAAEDLECAQFDIKNAFTEAHLKEKIYLAAPKGINIKKGHVLEALRSLYGLKQAAQDWNLLIKGELLKWGFEQSLADPCMFTHAKRGLKLLVYVDDVIAAAKTQDDIDWFYKKLSSRFNAKNLGRYIKSLVYESTMTGRTVQFTLIKSNTSAQSSNDLVSLRAHMRARRSLLLTMNTCALLQTMMNKSMSQSTSKPLVVLCLQWSSLDQTLLLSLESLHNT